MTFAAVAAPPLTTALATTTSFITICAALLTIGLLLAISFLLFDVNGALDSHALKLRTPIFIASLTWALAVFLNVLALLATILDSTLMSALDPTILRSFLTQIPLGQYWFVQMVIALIIAGIAPQLRRTTPALLLLLFALLGLIAPIFQSHSASSGSHALAIGSLIIHVAAISLWVGGALALLFIDREESDSAVSRFSALALWAAWAVVISGMANAFTRLNFLDAWSSAYARVVIVKVILSGVLIYFGYRHRKNIAGHAVIDRPLLAHLLLIEALVMVCLLGLGSWLSNQQPPVRPVTGGFNRAYEITGLSMPAKPTPWRVFWAYDPDALMIGLLILAALLYFKGVAILKKRGDTWPVGRSVAFVIGLASIDFATSGGLGVYAKFSFSYHMIAHMTLGMIAPIFIILSAPITLALRTLPQGRGGHERGVRGTLVAIMHSRVFGIYANPVVALAIFDGSLFALYLTPLFGNLMARHEGHIFMNIHFILAGALFFHVIIGVDPNPRKIPHLARIVTLFAAMSIHAFFSVAVMSSSTLLDGGYYEALQTPWITNLLADQRQGGAIGWAMGEVPILIALVATFIQWMRDDSREGRRMERLAQRQAAMGQPDELAKYNAYLAELAERDRRRDDE